MIPKCKSRYMVYFHLFNPFSANPHKMVKLTQTIRRLLPQYLNKKH